LLEDRKGETLRDWLKEHPEIEIISRDRAGAYRSGAESGCPNAIQVADRFHLVQNLAGALEDFFSEHPSELKAVSAPPPLPEREVFQAIVSVPPPEREKADIIHSRACRARRLINYEQTHELYREGWDKLSIARHLGISIKTLDRFLQQPAFPERQESQTRGRSRCLEPYKNYLLERWNSGCYEGKLLWREVSARGCTASYNSVARFLRCLKAAGGTQKSNGTKVILSRTLQLTARRAAWLLVRHRENLSSDETDLFARLKSNNSLFEETLLLSEELLVMIRDRKPEEFDSWLERAGKIASRAFVRFVNGLVFDYQAVRAALTLPWSNGKVEGQVNRLKMLKRQMYGRASFSLLSQRILLYS
jgi:transposase